MADEKLTLELQIQGVTDTLQQLRTVGGALEHISRQSAGGAAIGSAVSGGLQFAMKHAAPIAAAVALGAALAGLVSAVTRAAHAMNEFSKLQDMLGSSTGETAMLRIIGGALGIGDMAGFASSLRQGGMSGLGSEVFTRYGIPIQPNDIGGAVNEGALALKFFEGLRNTAAGPGGMDQARSDARNVGQPQAIQAARISKEMWAQILRDGKEVEALLGPDHQQRAFELNIAMTRLSEKWGFLKTLFLSAFIPVLEQVINGIINLLRLLAVLPGSGVNQSEIDSALNANTSALGQNTRALDNMSGIYGGGRRARGAIPGAFGPGAGYALQGALRAHGLRLGYYSVGS